VYLGFQLGGTPDEKYFVLDVRFEALGIHVQIVLTLLCIGPARSNKS
jgi:hypothetical protein